MSYTRRVLDDELDDLLGQIPAILIDGPKGVGKTETALKRAKTVYRLDDPNVLQIIQADPSGALRDPASILIDEWQRFPPIWDVVKRNVDLPKHTGPFIMTGSAYVPNATVHSGAMRIHDLRMRPMTLIERGVTKPTVSLRALASGERKVAGSIKNFGLQNYVQEIVASGFPGIRTLNERAQQAMLDSYLSNIVKKDFPEAGHKVRKPDSVMAWLRAYAAATSTTTSYEKIRDASNPRNTTVPAKTTTLAYIEVLRMLRILDEVPAWLPGNNFLTELGQAPKHHLVDPALAARALGMTRNRLIGGENGPIVYPGQDALLGALFESLVTLCVRVYAQAMGAQLFHLRTRDTRHEVDLILVTADGKVIGIEVKLSPQVKSDDVKHLHWLKENAKTSVLDLLVITTGDTAFRRSDDVAVIPLALLGQ